jgi:hypothetical protein
MEITAQIHFPGGFGQVGFANRIGPNFSQLSLGTSGKGVIQVLGRNNSQHSIPQKLQALIVDYAQTLVFESIGRMGKRLIQERNIRVFHLPIPQQSQ